MLTTYLFEKNVHEYSHPIILEDDISPSCKKEKDILEILKKFLLLNQDNTKPSILRLFAMNSCVDTKETKASLLHLSAGAYYANRAACEKQMQIKPYFHIDLLQNLKIPVFFYNNVFKETDNENSYTNSNSEIGKMATLPMNLIGCTNNKEGNKDGIITIGRALDFKIFRNPFNQKEYTSWKLAILLISICLFILGLKMSKNIYADKETQTKVKLKLLQNNPD